MAWLLGSFSGSEGEGVSHHESVLAMAQTESPAAPSACTSAAARGSCTIELTSTPLPPPPVPLTLAWAPEFQHWVHGAFLCYPVQMLSSCRQATALCLGLGLRSAPWISP